MAFKTRKQKYLASAVFILELQNTPNRNTHSKLDEPLIVNFRANTLCAWEFAANRQI